MRHMIRVRITQGIALFLLALGLTTQPVLPVALACSGGPPRTTLDTVLEEADYLVKGTIIQLDDAQINAILQAEAYLMGGSGPAFLLLNRVPPSLSAVFVGHGYDTGCLYGGAGTLSLGTVAYWAVAREPDGSYRVVDTQDAASRFFVYEQFNPDLNNIPYITVRIDPQGEDEWDNIRDIEFTEEAEFLEFVQTVSAQSPALPQSGRIPLLRPLIITYEDGTNALLPVDGGEPVITTETPDFEPWSAFDYPEFLETPLYCAEVGCRLTTPDNSVYALQISQHEIEFSQFYYQRFTQSIVGEAFQFSPNGEAFAVWNEGVMQVYLLQNALCDCLYFGSLHPTLGLTVEIPLRIENFSSMRWSMDGTTFAYADSDGLWVMDVFRQTAPELLIAGSNPIRPLSLFTSGRFVAYSMANTSTWTVQDRVTRETYEQALFSPDERYIVYVDDPLSHSLPEEQTCAVPISQNCFGVLDPTLLQSLTWTTDSNEGFAILCELAECQLVGVPVLPQTSYMGQVNATMNHPLIGYNQRISDAVYDDLYGGYALVLDDRDILIYGPTGRAERLFETDSGEIVSVRWMDSLFYTVPR